MKQEEQEKYELSMWVFGPGQYIYQRLPSPGSSDSQSGGGGGDDPSSDIEELEKRVKALTPLVYSLKFKEEGSSLYLSYSDSESGVWSDYLPVNSGISFGGISLVFNSDSKLTSLSFSPSVFTDKLLQVNITVPMGSSPREYSSLLAQVIVHSDIASLNLVEPIQFIDNDVISVYIESSSLSS